MPVVRVEPEANANALTPLASNLVGPTTVILVRLPAEIQAESDESNCTSDQEAVASVRSAAAIVEEVWLIE